MKSNLQGCYNLFINAYYKHLDLKCNRRFRQLFNNEAKTSQGKRLFYMTDFAGCTVCWNGNLQPLFWKDFCVYLFSPQSALIVFFCCHLQLFSNWFSKWQVSYVCFSFSVPKLRPCSKSDELSSFLRQGVKIRSPPALLFCDWLSIGSAENVQGVTEGIVDGREHGGRSE